MSSDHSKTDGIRLDEDMLTITPAEVPQIPDEVEVRGALRRISILRGGKGSGHFRHEGRPGEVGGSQPGKGTRGEAAGPEGEGGEPPPKRGETGPPPAGEGEMGEGGIIKKLGDEEVRFDSEEQFQLVMQLAENKVADAEGLEPELTEVMEKLAGEHGGQMVGLEHSVKGAASLARKIRMDMLEKGLTEEQAAAQITDANRYTMSFQSDEFVAKVQGGQAALQSGGWQMYDHKWKNYFQSGDAYDGYNTVMHQAETGRLFELQFHTPESLTLKEQSHELYNRFRVLGADQQTERRNLWREMVILWEESESYSKPPNWWLLQGVMK